MKNYAMAKRVAAIVGLAVTLMLVSSALQAQSECDYSDTTNMYTSTDGFTIDTSIPTLGEWGMIFMSVLIVGWMAWVLVRRRQKAVTRI